jgi:LPS-assembly lipoprotein
MLTRRGTMAILGAAVLALPGCGFRPLLSQNGDEGVRDDLAAVEIGELGGRVGQILHTQLEDDLNPTALSQPTRYLLNIRLRRTTNALAIQLDNTITRYNLTLTADFQLLDRASRAVLYQAAVSRVASYNQRRAPFATLVAEQDAERRAAKEISNNIRTLLAVHFQRQAPAV